MNICANCKYVDIISADDGFGAYFSCKQFPTINPIDGYISYKNCKEINQDGDCCLFEEKIPLIKQFINLFK